MNLLRSHYQTGIRLSYMGWWSGAPQTRQARVLAPPMACWAWATVPPLSPRLLHPYLVVSSLIA
jgi:hypothetical protein